MFEHLKILANQDLALNEIQLLDLSKINVICGKNNSGKSTLLTAISSRGSSLIGKAIEGSSIDFFFDKTIKGTGWDGDPLLIGQNERYRQLIEDIASRENKWYSDEHVKFVKAVEAEYQQAVGGATRWKFPDGELLDAYKKFFDDKCVTVLIPPKRHMQLYDTAQQRADTAPTGAGILHYLFYSRNQPVESEEWKIYDRINHAFTSISSGVRFDTYLSSEQGKHNRFDLTFSYKDGRRIEAEKCGLGLQELLIILYFAIHPDYHVVLIEEPESHLHPDLQRKLLSFLRTCPDKQFFLTTHSNIFLDAGMVDRVFFTSFDESITVDDATNRAALLGELGYAVTDNLVSDLVILHEGPTDVPILEEFLIKMGLYGEYNIKFWPLGGDIMDRVDLSVFSERNLIIALVDKEEDKGSTRVRKRFVENCAKYGITVHQLERYAIENYFTLRALRHVFEGQIDAALTEIEPDKKLEEQIGMNVKKNNRRLAQAMTIEEIEPTDLYEFFQTVKNACESKKAA